MISPCLACRETALGACEGASSSLSLIVISITSSRSVIRSGPGDSFLRLVPREASASALRFCSEGRTVFGSIFTEEEEGTAADAGVEVMMVAEVVVAVAGRGAIGRKRDAELLPFCLGGAGDGHCLRAASTLLLADVDGGNIAIDDGTDEEDDEDEIGTVENNAPREVFTAE